MTAPSSTVVIVIIQSTPVRSDGSQALPDRLKCAQCKAGGKTCLIQNRPVSSSPTSRAIKLFCKPCGYGRCSFTADLSAMAWKDAYAWVASIRKSASTVLSRTAIVSASISLHASDPISSSSAVSESASSTSGSPGPPSRSASPNLQDVLPQPHQPSDSAAHRTTTTDNGECHSALRSETAARSTQLSPARATPVLTMQAFANSFPASLDPEGQSSGQADASREPSQQDHEGYTPTVMRALLVECDRNFKRTLPLNRICLVNWLGGPTCVLEPGEGVLARSGAISGLVSLRHLYWAAYSLKYTSSGKIHLKAFSPIDEQEKPLIVDEKLGRGLRDVSQCWHSVSILLFMCSSSNHLLQLGIYQRWRIGKCR